MLYQKTPKTLAIFRIKFADQQPQKYLRIQSSRKTCQVEWCQSPSDFEKSFPKLKKLKIPLEKRLISKLIFV